MRRRLVSLGATLEFERYRKAESRACMSVGDALLDQEGTVEELEAKIVGTGSCVSLPRQIIDEKRGTLSEM